MKEKQVLQELRAKDSKELMKEIQELAHKITELRFRASFRKLKNFRGIRLMRKRLARIWTILAERALAELTKKEVKHAK